MPPAPDPAKTGQQQQQNPDEPAALTEDRVTEIVNASVNAAVTSQLKRSLGKELATAVAAALEPLKTKLEAVPVAPAPPPDDKAPDKSKPDPIVASLQKQLDEMKSALKAKDEEAAAERKAARDEKAFGLLVTELTGKVRPGAERMVATLLKAQGQLVLDDDGNASLKVRTSLAKGSPEQDHEFPIADGVGHYLKTKDAALFLPPPNSGGAGGDRRVPATPRPQAGQVPTYATPAVSDEEKARRTVEQLQAQGVSLADL